jgi:hypothetical protein
MSLQYISDDLAGCYDGSTRQFSEIALNSKTTPLKTKKCSFISDVNMNFQVIKDGFNQYIGLGIYPEGMFMLYDSLGTAIRSFFEYPYKDADEKSIKHEFRAMAYQGKIILNPSGTKFAYTARFADVIHFYAVSNKNIQLIKKVENRFCEYAPDEGGRGYGSAIKPTNRNGYADIYTTEKYVYLLYSGKTILEYREKMLESNQLKIYDWSGQLLKEIELDIPCKYFCVSPDDKNMWAIAEIPEPTIVRFDLTDTKKKNSNKVSSHTDTPGNAKNSTGAKTDFVSPLSSNVNREKSSTQNALLRSTLQPSLNGIAEKSEDKNIKKVNMGKIHSGEERKYVLPVYTPVESISATSTDISLRDSLHSAEISKIIMCIIKQHPGVFTDTVTIIASGTKIQLIYTGEVVE